MCRKIAITIHKFNAEMYEEGVGKSSIPMPAGAFGGGLDVDGGL